MEVALTRCARPFANYSKKCQLPAHPGRKNKISYSRSRYVYENKENMDKMARNYADIFGNSTPMERHFVRRSEQKSGKFPDGGSK